MYASMNSTIQIGPFKRIGNNLIRREIMLFLGIIRKTVLNVVFDHLDSSNTNIDTMSLK